MQERIYCRVTGSRKHSFYVAIDGKEYYLFSQDYRKGVHEYFSGGVSVSDAINFSKAKHDNALTRTMEKIPMYLKYVEKECGIKVLEQTKKNTRAKKKADDE